MDIFGITGWERISVLEAINVELYCNKSLSITDCRDFIENRNESVNDIGGVLFSGNVGGMVVDEKKSERMGFPVRRIGPRTFRELWYSPNPLRSPLSLLFEHQRFPTHSEGMFPSERSIERVDDFIRRVTDSYEISIYKIEFVSFVFKIVSDISLESYEEILLESYELGRDLFGEESAQAYNVRDIKRSIKRAYRHKFIEVAHL